MAYYIKANPKVAQFLGLQQQRYRLPDGNYLLWQNDMLAFAPIWQLADACKRIGGVMLDGDGARMEQRGEQCVELPQAEDEQFRTDEPAGETAEAEAESEEEPQADEAGEGETE